MRFNVDEKHFENEAFRKPDDFTLIIVDNREIYVTEFSSSINPKWPEIFGFSLTVRWTETVDAFLE